MSRCMTDTDNLTAVADAIRIKGGTSAQLVYPAGFVSAIQAIQTGVTPKLVVTTSAGAAVTAVKRLKNSQRNCRNRWNMHAGNPGGGRMERNVNSKRTERHAEHRDRNAEHVAVFGRSGFCKQLLGRSCNVLPQRERAVRMGCGRQHAYDDRRCRLSGRYHRQEP